MTLRTESLALGFGERTLVGELSIRFGAGEIWGVLGPNGCGKTTLVHALAGLHAPASGAVFLDDAPIASLAHKSVARRLGVLLQDESREFWGSVRDYVLLGRYPHASSAFGWSAEDEEIAQSELARQHLSGLGARAYASLSGGERQRARAAALFAQQPAVFLLDEPLQHLDLPHQVAILDRLALLARQDRRTVVMVLHDLQFASRYCDRFLLLHGDGGFSLGNAAEVLTEPALEALYGFPIRIAAVGDQRVFLPGRQGRDNNRED
ncbi:MAG: ABC transporter ATP-binding protein [Burkholderiales bacterium]